MSSGGRVIPKFTDALYYDSGDLYWVKTGQRAGWYCTNGYRMVDVEGKKYLEHRIIFYIHHGYWPELVDHINQDKLDNRIQNLRESDKRLNAHNSKIRVDNSSGVRGVSFSKSNSKWWAYIWLNGKRISGKYHKDFEAAVYARKQLEKEYI